MDPINILATIVLVVLGLFVLYIVGWILFGIFTLVVVYPIVAAMDAFEEWQNTRANKRRAKANAREKAWPKGAPLPPSKGAKCGWNS